jgi:hypothetical protein
VLGRLLGQGQVVDRVPPPRRRVLPARRQLLERVLADRLQHPEPRRAVRAVRRLEQTLLRQREQPVQAAGRAAARAAARAGHGRRALGGAAPGEDAQPPEERLLRGRQEGVAPRDGVPQRPLARRGVPRPAGEQGQAPLQPRPQRRGREHPRPGGRQLDGQGQPVQPHADVGGGRQILGREGQVRPGRRRPRDEQPHRLGQRRAFRRRRVVRAGQAERGDDQLVLAGEAQGRPAGRQHREAGAAAEEVGHQGRDSVREVLAVVQHQQEAPVAQERR